MRVLTGLVLAFAMAVVLGAQDTVGRVRAWRAQHEPQILRELFDLVAIPNVASEQGRHRAQCRGADADVREAPLPAGDHCRPAGVARRARRAAGTGRVRGR